MDGKSWTPINPLEVSNYREKAGLPNGNEASKMVIGKITKNATYEVRPELPLDGNPGGLVEYYFPSQPIQNQMIEVLQVTDIGLE